MFSGIVEEYAEVVRLEKEQTNLHLTLKCSFVDELKIDQSIAHNGVCLTVVSIQDVFTPVSIGFGTFFELWNTGTFCFFYPIPKVGTLFGILGILADLVELFF